MSGFRKTFKEVATGEFGSGWAWLVVGPDGLDIMSTSDADLPLMHGKTALVCCDVWEHAYYLDYQNERGKFVDGFLENLMNWDFVARNWEKAKKS
jgi:Fe-Mn family superoxide dismutase